MKSIDKRRNTILNLVKEYGELSFQQLRDTFPGVSDVTLRKDLQYLSDTQQAIRTHGGIKSIPSMLNYYYRSNFNQDKKKAIAAKAAALLQPGDSMFLSAGTTCAELARCLPVFPLKVYSNGIYTVCNISTLPNISVEILGGDVDLNIMRAEGLSALNRLDSLHFSIACLGALCLNLNFGFGHNNAITVAILEKVIEHSDQVVVLMDSTKITNSIYPHMIPISSVNTLVTDDDFPPDVAKILQGKNIRVI